MTALLVTLVAIAVLIWLIGAFVLQGTDHRQFDVPIHPPTGTRTSASAEHENITAMMAAGAQQMPKLSRSERLPYLRNQLEQMGAEAVIEAELRDADADGVPAEWVIAPNAVSSRRLLYIHGGGYTMGSALSHRVITSRMSALSGSMVLAINYRLMPEHARIAGVEDCRTAYKWIIANGPDGPQSLDSFVLAGDSAGGNLALSTIAWARDAGLRAADAVVALSPPTDATLASPSLVRNSSTDIMLGPLLGPFAKLPRPLTVWFGLFSNRMNPNNPVVSPLFGDLADLPPTLIHASEAEMLLDDAIRYVNKAVASGTKAKLQTWPFMLHVWHAFAELPESEEAYSHISDFLTEATR